MSNEYPLIDKLLPEKTVKEILEKSILEAKQKLPQIKNYNVGGAFRTILEIDALLHSELWEYLKHIIIPNMFVVSATGQWLDLHAQTFGITRKPASKTIGKVVFIRDAEGNIKIPLGTIIKTKPDIFGEVLEFKTIEEKVLTEDLNEIEIKVEAIKEGSQYNTAPYTINTLTTYLPVKVENRENWIIKEGTDEEDDESLRNRIMLVWNTKTMFVDNYYRYHTLSVNGVVDCYIDNQHPRGQGTADIYIVSTNITPTEQLLNQVQSYINKIKTPAADILVKPAQIKPIDIHIKLYSKPNIVNETLQAEAESLIRALFTYNSKYESLLTDYKNRMFKIGRTVKVATIIDAIMNLSQIENVELLNPTSDVSVLPQEVPVLNSLTIEVV